MQSLDVISINIWQVLISLANLAILFLIVKHFLFRPVQRVLEGRRRTLDAQYAAAGEAEAKAEADRQRWSEKLAGAQAEADALVRSAAEAAREGSDAMMADARDRADRIVHQAEEDAKLEYRKAEAGLRQELAGVSTELAGKLLGREINESDHQALIDSFIEELGDSSGADR